MAASFDEHEFVGQSTVFSSFFGRTAGSQTIYSPDSSAIEIELKRVNGEKRALLRKRGTYADSVGPTQKNTDVEKYTKVARNYPLIDEIGDIHANQLDQKMFGEPSYDSGWTKQERARRYARQIHTEHVRRIGRTHEWLASQSILTAQQPLIEGASVADDFYDFYRNSDMTVTVATPWDGSTDPINDFDDGWLVGRELGQVNLSVALCGSDAWEAFIKNSTITSLADSRRLLRVADMVNGQDSTPPNLKWLIEAGAVLQMKLMTYQGHPFWIFTYPDGYTNSSGDFTEWMTTDNCLLFDPNVRADRYFGPNERLPMTPAARQLYQAYMGMDPMALPRAPKIKAWNQNFDARMFHFDLQENIDRTSLKIRTQSAPIFAPVHTDAYYLMQGLIT
jgi:hypothetical protein